VRCRVAVSISILVVNILHYRLPVTSGRFGQSSDELLSYIQVEIHVNSNLFQISTANCDLPFTLTSHSNRMIPVVLTDPENTRIAVEMSLLSYLPTEIYESEVWRQPSLIFTFSDSPFGLTTYKIATFLIG